MFYLCNMRLNDKKMDLHRFFLLFIYWGLNLYKDMTCVFLAGWKPFVSLFYIIILVYLLLLSLKLLFCIFKYRGEGWIQVLKGWFNLISWILLFSVSLRKKHAFGNLKRVILKVEDIAWVILAMFIWVSYRYICNKIKWNSI